MKSIIWIVIVVLLSAVPGFAQLKNAKTDRVTVYGNCGMCKTTIEKAGRQKKAAMVQWDQDSQIAVITYDSTRTNTEEILKRIALAGYDNERFRAPDDVYAQLPGCCQYDRAIPSAVPTQNKGMQHGHNHQAAGETASSSQEAGRLQAVFNSYFPVKDALFRTDAATAAEKAAQLVSAIKAVEMGRLNAAEHQAWMAMVQTLTANAAGIAASRDIAGQRTAFAALSEDMYRLAKVSQREAPVYYQHCPMYNKGAGANWLSKEKTIENPYYGAQMPGCGSVTETLE